MKDDSGIKGKAAEALSGRLDNEYIFSNAILAVLREHRYCTITFISRKSGISRPTLRKYLPGLEQRGLVRMHAIGMAKVYEIVKRSVIR